jgi:hypothetical protein
MSCRMVERCVRILGAATVVCSSRCAVVHSWWRRFVRERERRRRGITFGGSWRRSVVMVVEVVDEADGDGRVTVVGMQVFRRRAR